MLYCIKIKIKLSLQIKRNKIFEKMLKNATVLLIKNTDTQWKLLSDPSSQRICWIRVLTEAHFTHIQAMKNAI